MISTQPPPSYAAAMATNPHQNTTQAPRQQPHQEFNRTVSVPTATNSLPNNFSSNSNPAPYPTVRASTIEVSPGKTPSWQLDPSKAGNHKFQLSPPSYKP